MGKTSGVKSVFFLYVIFALLLVAGILGVAFYMTHILTIIRPDGQVSRSNWPQQYTEGFESYILFENDIPMVSAEGLSSLKKNQLWIQFLDEHGKQISEYNKPKGIPIEYSISELLELAEYNRLDKYTVSIVALTYNGQRLEYIIGFPIDITKVTMHFNSDRVSNSKSILFAIMVGLCFLVLIAGLIYGAWITKHLARIVTLSNNLATRTYFPKKATGVFGDAYKSLNELDAKMRAIDEMRTSTERGQEEWITNITHDLKTPLSPIRGYAELLADSKYTLSDKNRIQYGYSILRNTEYAEQLVNDLKLTYQLKNNILPLNKQRTSLARFLKELIIEILNQSDYSSREIIFAETNQEVLFCFDNLLFKRAINNLLYNALIHNPGNTKVHVILQIDDCITIIIKDNGNGMNAEEVNKLFERYYRGTNTEARTDGTGLGMTIAKQIVEIHGGSITVNSEPLKGTHIALKFPYTN